MNNKNGFFRSSVGLAAICLGAACTNGTDEVAPQPLQELDTSLAQTAINTPEEPPVQLQEIAYL